MTDDGGECFQPEDVVNANPLTRTQYDNVTEKTEAIGSRVTDSWRRSVDLEYASAKCVSKDVIDAWSDVYGLKTRDVVVRSHPPNDDDAKMRDVDFYKNVMHKVLTDTEEFKDGLLNDNLRSTSAAFLDDYDPSL